MILYSQLCTPFGSSGVDYFTPPFGAHSGTKTMGTGTFNFTGLIGSFHLLEIPLRKLLLQKTDKKDLG